MAIQETEIPSDPAAARLHNACRPSDPAIQAYVGLRRVTAQVDRQLDAVLRTHGLNRGQLNVLLTIGSDEGLTQQDLADRLGLTKANVSQLLSRLEANGLIRREPVARAYALYLTDTSRDQLITAVEDQEAVIRAHFAGLNVLEQAQLQTLVAKIEHATGDE